MNDPEPAGNTGIAVIGLAIGLLVAAAIVFGPQLLGSDDVASTDTASTGLTAPPTVSTPTTALSSDNGDAVDLVVAYGRSRTEDHALSGDLLRPGQSPVPVRRAIMDGRAIDEVGITAAVTEAGETQQCELIDEQWLCAPPLPAISSEMDVQGFATLLLTEEPTYSVFSVSSEPPDALSATTSLGPMTCWSMVSEGRVDRARFGAETTLCFHDELGALIGRATETSAGSDLFVAKAVSGDVTEADVEPSR